MQPKKHRLGTALLYYLKDIYLDFMLALFAGGSVNRRLRVELQRIGALEH